MKQKLFDLRCAESHKVFRNPNTKPLLAPLTRAEELRQELLDLTGEVYLQIQNDRIFLYTN